MNLVFLGPPGAGKGTQAETFGQNMALAHISTGEILREAVANSTELGAEAKAFMDRGALVPDELVVSIVAERLERDDCRGGFILDGFPRTLPQAEALSGTLDAGGRGLDGVLYFKVDDDKVVRRLSGRRMCRDCGANFHLEYMPPAAEGICDKCGGELYQRDDDKAETVRERLKVYYAETSPLVDYYRRRGLLVEVDASLSPKAVRLELQAALSGITRS